MLLGSRCAMSRFVYEAWPRMSWHAVQDLLEGLDRETSCWFVLRVCCGFDSHMLCRICLKAWTRRAAARSCVLTDTYSEAPGQT